MLFYANLTLMKAQEFNCKVSSFRMLTPTVFELAFDTDKPMEFKAGQFISIVIPKAGPHGRDLRRAYSIASSPETKPVELCVKLVDDGPGTQYLYQLRAGITFRGYAPYGDFVYHMKPAKKVCFIATGTGIAPFRSIIASQEFQNSLPEETHLFFGVRTENELLYTDFFADHPEVQFAPTVSQPTSDWKGHRGRVTDYIRTLGNGLDWTRTEFYLCGHGGMITEIKEFLADKGVEKTSIHQEIYYK